MPHSNERPRDERSAAGQSLAVLAESLYVANLLILPFLAFAVLVVVYLKKHQQAPALAKSHLDQTVFASVSIAIMFVVCAGSVLLLRSWGMEDVGVWMIVVIVFTIIHATMVLLGVLGLAKAMAGKCWRYPVFGKKLPIDCPR
ncbi:MAG: hypothetical protein KJP15_04955 [Gammaproteobacteria bacterium]|nr:hypothetical protein [Gammaproteobacteria bacterium]